MGLPVDLRPALAEGVETRDFGPYGIVAAPGGSAHLYLEADEFAIVGCIDGSRTAAELGGDAATELLDELWNGGFLAGSPRVPQPRATVTLQGIEFRGANRPMQFLYRHFGRLFFTPVGVFVLVAVSVAGLVVLGVDVATGQSFVLQGVSPVVALLVLRVLDLIAVVLHETGHAMVIARHDRRVGRVGVGFYWGSLSFYVDASDALFLDRRVRMLQAAGGCITDMFVCGAALLIAMVFAGGHAAEIFREFAALTYISVLLQVVPLLELDGYWFLADALDQPHLHHDAMSALRDFLHRRNTNGRLAAYGAANVTFGVIAMLIAIALWWSLFGSLFHEFWAGGIVYKLLGVYLLLPFIAMAFQLASRGRRALNSRRRGLTDSKAG